MLVLITPSLRTAVVWGTLSHYPANLEIAVMVLSVVALPLITTFSVQRVDRAAMPASQQGIIPNASGGTYVDYPGPPHPSDVAPSILLFLFPLLVTLAASCLNLFWFYSQSKLHPVFTLVWSIVLTLFWTVMGVLTFTIAIQLNDDISKHLGLSVPVGCVGALCIIGIALIHLTYTIFSARAIHILRTCGPAPTPTKSEYASEYTTSFPDSTAGSARRVKLFHTPTRERFSSEFSSHINSPIQRDEEDVLTVRDAPRSPSTRSVTAVPGGSGVPPMPTVPEIPPPVPAKGPNLGCTGTSKTVKSAKSASGSPSPLSPRSPRSPLSPRMKSSLRRSVTTSGTKVEKRMRKEGAPSMVRTREQEGAGFIGCRERGMSLEGKAKRELQRIKLRELDTKKAEEYRFGQRDKAGRVLGA